MKIAKLEPSQRVKDRWLVWLEDGSLVRVTGNEVAAFALYTGMELSDETYDALTEAAGRSAVRAKALDYIASRPMSRKELVDKLTARRPRGKDGRERPPHATPEQAAQAADWLEDLGYLNDAQYAETLARHYSAKGYGERKVKDELFRRGIPREYWEGALAGLSSQENGERKLDELVERKLRGAEPTRENLKKVSDYLARRGYRWGEINDALRRYGAELEDAE